MTTPNHDLTTALAELADTTAESIAIILNVTQQIDTTETKPLVELQCRLEGLASRLRAGRAREGATCEHFTEMVAVASGIRFVRCTKCGAEGVDGEELHSPHAIMISTPTPPPAGARDRDVDTLRAYLFDRPEVFVDDAHAALDRIEARLAQAERERDEAIADNTTVALRLARYDALARRAKEVHSERDPLSINKAYARHQRAWAIVRDLAAEATEGARPDTLLGLPVQYVDKIPGTEGL